MKHRITLLVVLLALLVAPFAAYADAPTAEPPPGSNDPNPPTADAGMLCDPPFVSFEGDCVVPLWGNYSTEEVGALYTAAAGERYDIPGDPYLGVGAIKLAQIIRYLRTGTATTPTGGVITTVKIHATCKLFMEAERLDMNAYYKCVAIMARASADLKGILCPAIEEMLIWFKNPTTASQKQTLESLLLVQGAICI